MLIVDAQIHIWKISKPNPNHRQIADYSADDALKEMDEAGVTAAVIHPPGWDPNANALAVEAARQHPNRFAILGNFPLDRPESRSLIDGWKGRPGMLGLRFALLQPHQKTWLSDGTMDWLWPAADRAARARSATGYRSNRRAPSRTEADHRPLWQAGRNLVEPSRPHRNGQAPERGAQSHRGTELLAGALSLSRHPRPYSQALRCVRARADVLGHRHHPHADHMEAVRDDVHGGATLAARAGQRADHGARALRVACLEAAGMTAARSRG